MMLSILADGHLYTWGRGFNRHSDTTTPQCLPSSLHFTQVALGWNHALVLTGQKYRLAYFTCFPFSTPENICCRTYFISVF